MTLNRFISGFLVAALMAIAGLLIFRTRTPPEEIKYWCVRVSALGLSSLLNNQVDQLYLQSKYHYEAGIEDYIFQRPVAVKADFTTVAVPADVVTAISDGSIAFSRSIIYGNYFFTKDQMSRLIQINPGGYFTLTPEPFEGTGTTVEYLKYRIRAFDSHDHTITIPSADLTAKLNYLNPCPPGKPYVRP